MIEVPTTIASQRQLDELQALIVDACENGDSVSAIARRAGTTREMVSQIKNGSYTANGKQRSPGLDNILAIGEALGQTLTWQPVKKI